LLSAERFLIEKEYQMTLDMYNRVLGKIPKKSITEKIKQNIIDIEDYLDSIEDENEAPVVTLKIDPSSFKDGDQKQLTLGENNTSADKGIGLSESTIKEIAQSAFEAQKAIFESKGIHINADKVNTNKEKNSDSNLDSSNSNEDNSKSDGSNSNEDDFNSDRSSSNEDNSNSVESPIQGGVAPLGGNAESSSASSAGMSDASSDSGFSDNEGPEALDLFDSDEDEEEPEDTPPVQEIHGIMELKTPEEEDTPFLTLTYDFTKIPHAYALSSDYSIFEFAYYKYKSMLVKAHKFIKRKHITKALNYYRVIRDQNIPDEFKKMIDRNIQDITEYLEKYLVSR